MHGSKPQGSIFHCFHHAQTFENARLWLYTVPGFKNPMVLMSTNLSNWLAKSSAHAMCDFRDIDEAVIELWSAVAIEFHVLWTIAVHPTLSPHVRAHCMNRFCLIWANSSDTDIVTLNFVSAYTLEKMATQWCSQDIYKWKDHLHCEKWHEFSTSIYITPKIHIYLAQNCLTHARDLVVSKFNVCFTKAQVACKLHMNYGLFDARP